MTGGKKFLTGGLQTLTGSLETMTGVQKDDDSWAKRR
jgi:hypothetical protein